MAKQFANRHELNKWINAKNLERYPVDPNNVWQTVGYRMSDKEMFETLVQEGYTDLDNLLADGHYYDIGGHTNNGWAYRDEVDLDYISEWGIMIELRDRN